MVKPLFDDMPVNFGVRSAFTKGGSELIDALGYDQLKETARVVGTYVSRKLIVVGSEDATAFATGKALLGELTKLGVEVGTDDPRAYTSGISSFSNDNHVAVEDSAQRSGLWTPGVEQLVVVGSAPLFNGYFSRKAIDNVDEPGIPNADVQGLTLDDEKYQDPYEVPKGGGFILDPAVEARMRGKSTS